MLSTGYWNVDGFRTICCVSGIQESAKNNKLKQCSGSPDPKGPKDPVIRYLGFG